MKALSLLTILLLISSCATYYKDHQKFINSDHKQAVFIWDDDLRINYKNTSNKLPTFYRHNPSLFISHFFRKGDVPTHKLISLNIENDSRLDVDPHPFYSFLFHLASLGTIPYSNGHKLVAKAEIKNLQTNKSKTIQINLKHKAGSGWYYWIKKWTSDDWYWHKPKVDPYYKHENKYYRNYIDYIIATSE